MNWIRNTLDGMKRDGIPAYGIAALILGLFVVLGFLFGTCGKANAGTITLYCVATAYDDFTPPNESAYSNEAMTQAGEGADVTLQWNPPTTNEDGTPLTDLAGYNIYCGQTAGGPYNQTWNVDNALATNYTFKPNPTKRPSPPGNLR